jgi:hypothetical protein
MPDSPTQTRKLQWKWIGISMVLYALFYLLPLLIFAVKAEMFAFVWLFAGIIVISAIAGYLSEGVTIAEPAIAGAGLMLLFFVSMALAIPQQIDVMGLTIGGMVIMAVVFLLSLLGAWLGERAQKLWRSKPQEQAEAH